jgi:hypothetical protein
MNAHLFVILHAGGKMLFGLRVERLGHGMILTDADRITLEYGHSNLRPESFFNLSFRA